MNIIHNLTQYYPSNITSNLVRNNKNQIIEKKNSTPMVNDRQENAGHQWAPPPLNKLVFVGNLAYLT